jgi:HEAT repeat protein
MPAGAVDGAVLEAQQRRLSRNLSSRDSRDLFPLLLSRQNTHGFWRATVAYSNGATELAASSFLAEAANGPIVITGDPGSGKTTLLETSASDLIAGKRPAFFLRMGLWDRDSGLVPQLGGPVTVEDVVGDVVQSQPWVFFDAVDEAPGLAIDEAFQAITRFAASHPECAIVASCRAAELPAWVTERFTAARILPFSDAQVDEALHTAMASGRVSLRAEVVSDLKDLCKNPLMLSMTQELLLSGDALVLNITSPSQLYDRFIDFIDKREWGKRPSDPAETQLRGGLNLNLLGVVAWRLTEAQQMSVDETELGNWLTEALADPRTSLWWSEDRKPSVPWLVRMLSTRAPAKLLVSPTGGLPRLSFMHLTFRDALAARHLRHLCRMSSPDVVIGSLAEEKADGLDVPSERYWTVISMHAGSESNPGGTARLLMRQALAKRDQDILRLACRCIAARWNTKPADVGDLLPIVLDAFKNWDRAFDYDLMRASQGLVTRLSADYPVRLRQDLEYFVRKYAATVPRLLAEIPIDQVLALLGSQSSDVVIDAAFTLARRVSEGAVPRRQAAVAIAALIPGSPVDVLEQAVAALKDIGEPATLDLLRDIVINRRFSARAVAFAANAIAETGGQQDLSTIVDLLLDHEFQYRDSASWSLQKLVVRLDQQKPGQCQHVLPIYVRALQSETTDERGTYAKGNILYSLGVLGAVAHVAAIENAVLTETEPYVKEDGLLALAYVGRKESIPLIRSHLTDSDPAVRLKASEALRTVGALTANDIAKLGNDQYLILRDFADRTLLLSDDHFTQVARIAAAALARSPINTRGSRTDFRVTAEERAAVEEVCQVCLQDGSLSVMPDFLGQGAEHEVRFAASDVGPLRSKLAERLGS